jgi:PAS domain S-box-containing protein
MASSGAGPPDSCRSFWHQRIMCSLSILVVDDHKEVRQGIRALLSPRAGWLICGEASDGIEAIEKAKRLRPNVVLMDISMPRMQGIEATRIIRREVPESDVIIVSQNDYGLIHKAAAEAGATGFVDKSRISQDLLKTIEALAKNGMGRGPREQPHKTINPQVAVNLGNVRGTEPLASDTGNLIRKVFMQSPVAMGLLSGPEHRWTFVNPEMIRVSGRIRAEDFIGKTIRETMPELEGQPFFELLDTVYRTGVPHVGTEVKAALNSAATDQDQEIYFNFLYEPLRSPKEEVEGILVYAVEATSQVHEKAEHDKHGRASSLLAAIVDSSDDAIISKTLEGVITSWNKSAERLFGYTCEEAVGRHITLIVPEDRRDEEAKILERLKRGERIDHFETLRQCKNGGLLTLSLTISPVKDGAGRIVGASKVARDITERKEIERALTKRARLLDLSSDAIMVRDGADRVTYLNQSACDLYGYSREEAMGRVTHELFRTEFPEPLEHITGQLHRDGRWTGELIHRRKDGTKIVVASRWALDKDERGNQNCVLETNNDITQQKQNDEALRESEGRFRTLSNSLEIQVSQRTEELENRNAEILQQSEQLRELSNRLLKIQDDERRHIARELHDSAGQLIAGLSMNLAGINRQAKQNPSLAEALEETQNLVLQLNKEIRTTSYLLHPPLLDETGLSQAIDWYMQGLMERSGLKIKLDIDDFGRLHADLELAIFRIVQESLTNIHRHSGSKTATIHLSRTACNVLLEIQDQGKGIPAEKLAAIKAQRTGVGIAGMRERIRHFKGELDIQSKGTGVTIVVTFPLAPTVASGSEAILQTSEAAE